jgi:hypothetical protein
MPTTYPIAAAGDRQPKRAPPLAAGVKAAVKALVWGIDSDEGRRPATLAEAAAAESMRPDTLRRYLHRLDMRALIVDEKKGFLAWATSANAQALTNIRDTSANDAARVRAVLALEELETPRDGRSVSVVVNTAVGLAPIKPGYVVRLPPDLMPALPAGEAPPRSPEPEPLPAEDAERR